MLSPHGRLHGTQHLSHSAKNKPTQHGQDALVLLYTDTHLQLTCHVVLYSHCLMGDRMAMEKLATFLLSMLQPATLHRIHFL